MNNGPIIKLTHIATGYKWARPITRKAYQDAFDTCLTDTTIKSFTALKDKTIDTILDNTLGVDWDKDYFYDGGL